jgi:ectoine hydroxylase-related dioxygenase (phytanoyl-CoA dioxygenase family)
MSMYAETPGSDLEIVVTEAEQERGCLTSDHFRLAGLLLHTRGYVVLKRAVPPAIMAAVAHEFGRVYRDCVASKHGDSWYQVARETAAVFWERNHRWRIFPKLQGPFASPVILANPFARQLLEFLLGDGFYCKFVSSDTCTKGAVVQSPHRELGIGKAWDPQAYIVNIPLGRCGLDNGPLELWPGGSHLWQNKLLDRLGLGTDVQDGRNPDCEQLATRFPSRRLLLEAGDLLIRDPGLLHRGTENSTDEPRTLLTLCYFRLGHTHDYGQVEYNLDGAMWQQLEPGCRKLFAHAFKHRPKTLPAPRHGGLWNWKRYLLPPLRFLRDRSGKRPT